MTRSLGAQSEIDSLTDLLRCGLEYVALRALRDPEEARDALQETVTRTLAAVRNGTLPPGVRLPAFAYGILRHVIADAHQRRRRTVSAAAGAEDAPALAPSPLEQLITAEDERAVRRALARLTRWHTWERGGLTD